MFVVVGKGEEKGGAERERGRERERGAGMGRRGKKEGEEKNRGQFFFVCTTRRPFLEACKQAS